MKKRFIYLIAHIYLGIVHFFIPEEGDLFFRDERKGRKSRLKREKIKQIFPGLNVDS